MTLYLINDKIINIFCLLYVIENGRDKTVKRTVPIWITYILIIASIACIVFGIYRGEVDTVLTKAINICMECIGLG